MMELQTNNKTNRLPWVDVLKGVAILFIVAIHCGKEGLPRNFARLVGSGDAWVQMFLLLSVLLTLASYERFSAERKSGGYPFRWVIGKFIRLLPLYYLSVALSVLCTGGSQHWLGSEGGISALNILAHVFFVQGLFPHYANSIVGVEWYVGVLAMLYVLTPLIGRFVNGLSRAVLAFAVGVFVCQRLTVMAYEVILPRVGDWDVYAGFFACFWIVASLPSILLGVVLFFILKRRLEIPRAGTVALAVMALMLYHSILKFPEGGLFYFRPQLISAILFSLVILFASSCRMRMPCKGVFAFLGRHSYGLYLFHMLSLRGVEAFVPGGWAVRYLTCISVTILFTVVVERVVDAPLQNLLSGLQRWLLQERKRSVGK